MNSVEKNNHKEEKRRLRMRIGRIERELMKYNSFPIEEAIRKAHDGKEITLWPRNPGKYYPHPRGIINVTATNYYLNGTKIVDTNTMSNVKEYQFCLDGVVWSDKTRLYINSSMVHDFDYNITAVRTCGQWIAVRAGIEIFLVNTLGGGVSVRRKEEFFEYSDFIWHGDPDTADKATRSPNWSVTENGEIVFGNYIPFIRTRNDLERIGDQAEFYMNRALISKNCTVYEFIPGKIPRKLFRLNPLKPETKKEQTLLARHVRMVSNELSHRDILIFKSSMGLLDEHIRKPTKPTDFYPDITKDDVNSIIRKVESTLRKRGLCKRDFWPCEYGNVFVRDEYVSLIVTKQNRKN